MIFVGIDPGLSGAIAVLDGGAAKVYDMPLKPYGKAGKHRVNYGDLAGWLTCFTTDKRVHVTLEQVNAMPGQGTVSMFNFGGAYHGAWAVCEALSYVVHLVLPRTWKQYFGLGADKAESLALARKKYPGIDLRLKKHNGRAEALLIAEYGKQFYD